jgi:uncharacterized protein (TIGR03435 family)
VGSGSDTRIGGGQLGRGSLFTAVQEQLGLKLEPQRAPVDVLVVYAAERAAED